MKSKKKVAADVRDMLKDLAPPGPTAKAPDHLDSSFKKISIRIQIPCYAAITLLSLAVFFLGSLSLVVHSEAGTKARPAATAVKITSASHPSITSVALINKKGGPFGKITSPVAETVTGRHITITGFTENIPVDTPYIWLIVDVPSIGRCWPKSPEIHPNGMFQTTFYEGGPNNEFTVSLYAVGYGLNKTIEQWIAAGKFGGLPMIPRQYRLDSVSFLLNQTT